MTMEAEEYWNEWLSENEHLDGNKQIRVDEAIRFADAFAKYQKQEFTPCNGCEIPAECTDIGKCTAPKSTSRNGDVQIGESLSGDFLENTWTFEMQDGFHIKSGNFAIIPLEQWNEIRSGISMGAEIAKSIENGRNYLMGVEAKDLTVEDALEAFGFGRNGLK